MLSWVLVTIFEDPNIYMRKKVSYSVVTYHLDSNVHIHNVSARVVVM